MVSTVINLVAERKNTSDKLAEFANNSAWLLFVPAAAAALSVILAIKSPAFAAAITLMGLE